MYIYIHIFREKKHIGVHTYMYIYILMYMWVHLYVSFISSSYADAPTLCLAFQSYYIYLWTYIVGVYKYFYILIGRYDIAGRWACYQIYCHDILGRWGREHHPLLWLSTLIGGDCAVVNYISQRRRVKHIYYVAFTRESIETCVAYWWNRLRENRISYCSRKSILCCA